MILSAKRLKILNDAEMCAAKSANMKKKNITSIIFSIIVLCTLLCNNVLADLPPNPGGGTGGGDLPVGGGTPIGGGLLILLGLGISYGIKKFQEIKKN